MDMSDPQPGIHEHDFAVAHEQGERRTYKVILLTAITMVVEIVAGIGFGSMALLADGWHMGTHVAAFGITIFAYRYARRHANSGRYTFGTGKVSVLGGFASAVALAVVALVMIVESVTRLFSPHTIQFNEAIVVAVLGLIINLISALILHDHGHSHEHSHDEEESPHPHPHHDHNLRAAYLHVMADALTSVCAIAALLTGKYFGWGWMDPIMGIVGALVITRWALGLLRETSAILLDGSAGDRRLLAIRSRIETAPTTRLTDLHVWQVGPHHQAAILAIVTSDPRPADEYKARLRDLHGLSHITIEVNSAQAGLAP